MTQFFPGNIVEIYRRETRHGCYHPYRHSKPAAEKYPESKKYLETGVILKRSGSRAALVLESVYIHRVSISLWFRTGCKRNGFALLQIADPGSIAWEALFGLRNNWLRESIVWGIWGGLFLACLSREHYLPLFRQTADNTHEGNWEKCRDSKIPKLPFPGHMLKQGAGSTLHYPIQAKLRARDESACPSQHFYFSYRFMIPFFWKEKWYNKPHAFRRQVYFTSGCKNIP